MSYLEIILIGYIVNFLVFFIFTIVVVIVFLFLSPIHLLQYNNIINSIKSKKIFLTNNKVNYLTQENLAFLIPYAIVYRVVQFLFQKETFFESLQKEDTRLQKLIDTKIKG